MKAGGTALKRQTQVVRRPLARVHGVALFVREVREHISQAALQILFDRADVLAEGSGSGQEFFGTVMITLDLSACAELRDGVDASSVRRAAALLAQDPRAKERALEVAREQAARFTGVALKALDGDLRVQAKGLRVQIDVDLQARMGK